MTHSSFVDLSSYFTSAHIGQNVTFGGGMVWSLLGGSAQAGDESVFIGCLSCMGSLNLTLSSFRVSFRANDFLLAKGYGGLIHLHVSSPTLHVKDIEDHH